MASQRRSRARTFRLVGSSYASGPGIPRGRATAGALAIRGTNLPAISNSRLARNVARRRSNGGAGG